MTTLRVRHALFPALLLLGACGPGRAPQDQEPLSDGRGAHAGSFLAPGGNDAAAADMNTQAGNAQ